MILILCIICHKQIENLEFQTAFWEYFFHKYLCQIDLLLHVYIGCSFLHIYGVTIKEPSTSISQTMQILQFNKETFSFLSNILRNTKVKGINCKTCIIYTAQIRTFELRRRASISNFTEIKLIYIFVQITFDILASRASLKKCFQSYILTS